LVCDDWVLVTSVFDAACSFLWRATCIT